MSQDNKPYGCCGKHGKHCKHFDSDSSDPDQGQPWPIAIEQSCSRPTYHAHPDIVGVWDGTNWLLEQNESS